VEGRVKNNINLLPASFRRQQMLRNRIYQWSAAICVVLVMGWLFHWYELREQRAMAQRLEVLTREHQPTQVMLRQLVDMRQKLVDLEQQERIARELEHQRNALTLLGVISQTAQKTSGRLRITELELINFQSPQTPDKAGAPGAQASGLRLEGVSLDNRTVAELFVGLQQSGIFRRVEMGDVKGEESESTSQWRYEIKCEF
jgi:Tfp pilus assembly protein PilN